jgi:hypothetical protein
MTLLTSHFTLSELTRSSTAERLGIDNTVPPIILPHLRVTAEGLEQIRALLGFPLHVGSGYRCAALNTAVGGARESAHMDGYAADFVCPAFGDPRSIVKAIEASDIQFDKCIQEGTWAHISFAPTLRRELLTAHFGPAGTTYAQGV